MRPCAFALSIVFAQVLWTTPRLASCRAFRIFILSRHPHPGSPPIAPRKTTSKSRRSASPARVSPRPPRFFSAARPWESPSRGSAHIGLGAKTASSNSNRSASSRQGGSAKARSIPRAESARIRLISWITSAQRTSKSPARPRVSAFSRIAAQRRGFFSTATTRAAPRLSASSDIAPEPAHKSSTHAPATAPVPRC